MKLQDDVQGADYQLVHIQAPTAEGNTIHPAFIDKDPGWPVCIWHNGILKEHTIARLQREMNTDEPWDTALIGRGLTLRQRASNVEQSKFLSGLDGSYACFYRNGPYLFVFRNEIAPLFVDKDLNFSSIKFKGSNSIEPGIVFQVNFQYNRLDGTDVRFSTANNPYIL